jgi:hypothetical protein
MGRAMLRLVRRIDEVLESPYITETQEVDIKLIAVRVGTVLMAIGESGRYRCKLRATDRPAHGSSPRRDQGRRRSP